MLVSAESHVGSKALDSHMRPYIFRRRANGEPLAVVVKHHVTLVQSVLGSVFWRCACIFKMRREFWLPASSMAR